MTHGNSQPGFTPDETGHAHNPYQAPGSEGSTSPYGQAPEGAGSHGQTGSAANPYTQAEQPQYGQATTGQRFDPQTQSSPASAAGYGNSHNQAAPAGNSYGAAGNGAPGHSAPGYGMPSNGAAVYGMPSNGTPGNGSAGQTGPGQSKVIAGLDMNVDSTKWITGFAIAAFVAFIGTFMPWVTATAPFVGTISISGLEGDGVLIFILALIGIGAAVFSLYTPAGRSLAWRTIALMVIAGLALLIALVGMVNVASGSGKLHEYGGSVSPGIGLIIVLLGTAGMMACGVLAFRADKKRNAAPLFGGANAAGQQAFAEQQPFGGQQTFGEQQPFSGQQPQPYGSAPYAAPNTGTHTAPQNTPNAQPHYGSQPAQPPHTPSDSAQAPEAGKDTQD